MNEIEPTAFVSSRLPVPTAHQTGRTDFPYPAFRVASPQGIRLTPWPCGRAGVETTEASWGYYLLRAIPRSLISQHRARTSSVPSPKRATMNASDFQTDSPCLIGRADLLRDLSWHCGLAHRFGPPRLSDVFRPDVLTTLTPTEFAGLGDWVSCEHRPSHNTPAARRLRACKITRLIRCGSSSFRPVGSLPGLLNPLQPHGWTGTWPFRREPPNSTGATFTHEQHTLRGLLRGDLLIEKLEAITFLLFFGGAGLGRFLCVGGSWRLVL